MFRNTTGASSFAAALLAFSCAAKADYPMPRAVADFAYNAPDRVVILNFTERFGSPDCQYDIINNAAAIEVFGYDLKREYALPPGHCVLEFDDASMNYFTVYLSANGYTYDTSTLYILNFEDAIQSEP